MLQELCVCLHGETGRDSSGSSLGMPLGGICVGDGNAAALLSAVFSTATLLSTPLGGFWGLAVLKGGFNYAN